MKIIEDGLRYDEVLCAGIVFKERSFWDGQLYPSETALYLPDEDREDSVWSRMWDIIELVPARKNAELLRKAVIDESLPLDYPLLDQGGIIYVGGRRWDATLLGLVKYHKALPELSEAAKHDLDYELRARSVEAIGDMGFLGSKYASVILDVLLKDKSYYVKKKAAEAIKKVKNPEIAKGLRSAVEELRAYTDSFWELGYFQSKDEEKKYACDFCALAFQEALISLYKLDPRQGREELTKSLDPESMLVYHHAKNAFFLSGAEYPIIITGEEWRDRKVIPVNFYVPKDKRKRISSYPKF